MFSAFLNLNKSKGMTSAKAVAKLKHILLQKGYKINKIGHFGTLDPDGEGVLPIAIGRATRLFDIVPDKEKIYYTEFVVGKTTDTLDEGGTVTETCGKSATEEEISAIDGGNAINRFGQLNGLLIERRAGELFFETIFADAHGRARALRSVRGLERKDCAATSYLDGRIERVLSENAHFVLCSLKRSGRRSYIKREWLRRQDGELVSTHACPQALLRLRGQACRHLLPGGLL